MVTMTMAHWLYIIGVLVVVLTMLFRRNVVIPCVLFTFLIGSYYLGSMVGGVQVVFNASLVAAKELFSIFLIIGLMVGLLKAISAEGADEMMIKPMKGLMSTPLVSYLVIIVATVIISLFFWPTPAAPLLGALLIPAAVAAGLPPMMAAIALALAGQGMTLAADTLIQAAPGITAGAAGVPVEMLTSKATLLSLIAGVIALSMAWFMNRKEIKSFNPKAHEAEMAATKEVAAQEVAQGKEQADPVKGKILIWVLGISMLAVIVSMFAFDIKGGDSSALLGGVAILVISFAAMLSHGARGLDTVADYIADGLVFAFKVMGPIIPIAGFFFLGGAESAPAILGDGAPGFLFDVGKIVAGVIPANGFAAGFGLLILGAITGLDGSGFSGLPVVGTLAGAMAGGNANVAATLGSLGQMGAIWFGGGTLVAWSSLVAVAGICGVSVLELVRKNMIPVLTGLFVTTIFAVVFMM
ncbi:hypothetical protein MFMK1_002734 [Metallumcola ferriviriculae]|uniref:Transporter n=1 Tax=Metallumcola ferriviriculae TaxID=3039180 RepID=A0AAU0URJ5_9FIRM|nr:hypothetical protein MFMK1_002734 [Desulfitibacteraceae bacterium MK1]